MKQILIEALKLIDTPEKWTKGANARDKYHLPLSHNNREAVCYCAFGAINEAARKLKVDYQDLYETLNAVYDLLEELYGYPSLVYYNDSETTTHQDIINLFKKAIA